MARRKTLIAGFEAWSHGDVMKRFLLHSKQKPKRRYGSLITRSRLHKDIEIIDKSEKRVPKRVQQVYECETLGHSGQEMHIVCCYYPVKQAPITTFLDKMFPFATSMVRGEGGRGVHSARPYSKFHTQRHALWRQRWWYSNSSATIHGYLCWQWGRGE